MLYALAAETDRKVYFIHACDSGDVHALGDDVRAAAGLRSGIVTRLVYRFPTPRDLTEKRHDREGILTRDLLQEMLPIDDYDVYLCGPPPFMKVLYPMLRSLGIPKDRIAYEFFGPASVLDPDIDATLKPVEANPEPAFDVPVVVGSEITVTFQRSGRQVIWTDQARSLLDLAEDQGLTADFSCRVGICGTCTTRIVEGQVAYFEDPLDEPDPGHVLICCSKPVGSVVLDL